jgi:hypothetical protein
MPAGARRGGEMSASGLLEHLRSLEAELHHPGSDCTRERLETLLHPQFHEIGRSGRPYDRNTVVAYLWPHRAPDYRVEAFDHRVFELGDQDALLTYRSQHRGADGSVSHAAHRCSVWRRTAVGWQLFYHQGTPADGA